MTWPGVCFWLIIVLGLVWRWEILLFLLFSSFSFSALSVMPAGVVGGLNLPPSSVSAGLLVVRALLDPSIRREVVRNAADSNRFAVLTIFVVYSVLLTQVAVRLYSGSVSVVTLANPLSGLQKLAPTAQNLTTSLYLIESLMVTLAFAALCSMRDFEKLLLRAILFGGVVLAATGVLSTVADTLGLSSLLDPFRNASYTMLLEAEVLGTRRLTGLMPEASAFGGATALFSAALLFLQGSYVGRARIFALMTSLILLLFSVFSTSSTAYVLAGIIVIIIFYNLAASSIWRQAFYKANFGVLGLSALYAVLGFILAYAMNPHVFDHAVAIVDASVFQKETSASYAERMSWNTAAVTAFYDSSGLGIGLGSARTSSYYASLVSSVGVLGSALFLASLALVFTYRKPVQFVYRNLVGGLKQVLIISLCSSAVGSATADFGIFTAVLFGTIVGFCCTRV